MSLDVDAYKLFARREFNDIQFCLHMGIDPDDLKLLIAKTEGDWINNHPEFPEQDLKFNIDNPPWIIDPQDTIFNVDTEIMEYMIDELMLGIKHNADCKGIRFQEPT